MESMVEFDGGIHLAVVDTVLRVATVVTLETTCSSAKTLGREDRYPVKLSHTRRRSAVGCRIGS